MLPVTAIQPSPIELLLARDEHVAGLRLRSDPAYVRVRRGVYASTAVWQTLRPWERYLARVHAYAITHPGAVFSHESAAVLLGMPVFGEPRHIHVYDPGGAGSWRSGDVTVHTSIDESRVVDLGPFAATSVTETAVALARVLPPAFAVGVLDAALRPALLGEQGREELAQLASERSARRGRSRLNWALERANGRAESPGESLSRVVIEWLGFEPPELQRVFHLEGFTDRTDFYWEGQHVIGESDGDVKYGAPDPEEARRALLEEKRREDRLRRATDGFARWGWREAIRATPLRDALLAAGLPQVRHPQTVLLATLAHHPRSL